MTKESYLTSGTCSLQFDHTATDPHSVYPDNHSWDPTFPDPDPCWVTNDKFPVTENNGWQQMTSDDLDVQELTFLVSPNKDPWKVYEEDDIQLHPHVTVVMTVNLSPQKSKSTNNSSKPITIQTTTSSRIYDNLEWTIKE